MVQANPKIDAMPAAVLATIRKSDKMCVIYLSGKRVEYDIDTFLVCCSHYALHKGEISTGEDMILRDAIFSHQKLSQR
jgi:hypothetical protein